MLKFEELKDSEIVIVGMGYLGSNLYGFLKDLQEVYSFKLRYYNRGNLNQIIGTSVDYLFNCTGNTGDFRKQILKTVDSNISLNIFLLNNVKIRKCYLSLSSSRIYGFSDNSDIIFDEYSSLGVDDNHLSVDYIYNGAKKLMESMLMNYSKLNPDFKIIICRLSNVFGNFKIKDLDESTYLKLIIKHGIGKIKLNLNQNPLNSKGYIHINDAVRGIVLSATKSGCSDVYNLCSGISYNLFDWIDFFDIKFEEGFEFKKPIHSKISIKKSHDELGYTPMYFLRNLNIDQIVKHESNKHLQ